jgi:hypothetical protein
MTPLPFFTGRPHRPVLRLPQPQQSPTMFPGMAGPQGLAKHRQLDVGIDRGRLNVRVAEKVLHLLDGGATFVQVRCKGVAQRVRGDPRWEPGAPSAPLHDLPDNAAPERAALPSGEDPHATPNARQVQRERLGGNPRQRGEALVTALAPHEQNTVGPSD